MTMVGKDRVYIIAEAGVNHNGRRDLAFALIDAAADAGADAVKFQTFDAHKLASKGVRKAAYQTESSDANESQLARLQRLELPREWHADLQDYCRRKGLDFLSTAFDAGSLAFLVELGIHHLDDCLKLLRTIKHADARRIQIMHPAWEEGDAHEAVRIKITANGALTHQAEAVTADDLLELAKELERAAGNFVKFAAGAKMLGAFHSPA